MDLDGVEAGTVAAAREAGRLLLDHLGHVRDVEYKGAVDLVTEADRASEALLVARLAALLPEASLLAEEGSEVRRSPELRWVVDPLDGTTNFAHGYPLFCVSILLEQAGERVLGVVFDPTRDEMFTARRGGGSRRNGEPLRVSGARTLDEALVTTGFPYDVRTSARDNLAQFAAFLKRAQAVRRDGTAALNLAYVAAGRFDGFWEEKLAPWDLGAGALLVEEAGGRVTGYGGAGLDLAAGHVVAANPALHEAMLGVLDEVESSSGLPPVGPRSL